MRILLTCFCCLLFNGHLEAKTSSKKQKTIPTKATTTVKKPILGHEQLVNLLINDLPLKLADAKVIDFNQRALNFTASFIARYSAVASSINWSDFVQKQKDLYPIKDDTLPRFLEIMLQSNFKNKVLSANRNIDSDQFEALYFAYRFYLAELNSELSHLAKGKASVSIEDARKAFVKARITASESYNKHIATQKTLDRLSQSSLYFLGDFLLGDNPTQVPSKQIGMFHSESIVQINTEANYAFEIYNFIPKKVRTMSFKNFQLVGLEKACAILFEKANRKFLVLASDVLSNSASVPVLEYFEGKITYQRSVLKSQLGTQKSITPDEALVFKTERLRLLPFYRNDVDAKRKSRIEAAQESLVDGNFVEGILKDLNNGKSLEEVLSEKTNGLERARRRLYTVFDEKGEVNSELTEATRLGYEKALQNASRRTGIPSVVIETSLYLESSFDPLSENTKEKRERKGSFELSGDVWGMGLAQLSPAESLMPIDEFYNFKDAELSDYSPQPIAYGAYVEESESKTESGQAVRDLINKGILSESDFVVTEYTQEVEVLLRENNWKQLSAEQLKILDDKVEIRRRSILKIQEWIRLAEKSPRSVWSPFYAIQRFADHLYAIQKQHYTLMGGKKAGPHLFGDKYSMRTSDQMRFILAIYNRGQGYLSNSLDFQRVYNGGVLIPGNYYYTWAAGRGKTPEEKLSMLQSMWESERYFVLPKALELREKPTRLRPTLETQFINLRHIIYGFGLGEQPHKDSVFNILNQISRASQ